MRSCAQQVRGVPPPAGGGAAVRSGGKPLDAATRAYFEPRFGHDFSSVRVHSDAHAASSIGAAAFTTGDHITFRDENLAGRRALLAHELTHVVQQRSGPVMPGMSRPGDPGESAADRNADAVLRGGYARVEGTAHAVQRSIFDSILEPPPLFESVKWLAEAKRYIEEPDVDEATREELRVLIARAESDIAVLQGKGEGAQVSQGSAVGVIGAVGFAGGTRSAGMALATKPNPWMIAAGLLLLGAAWLASTSGGRSARDEAMRDLGEALDSMGRVLRQATARPRPVAPPVTEAPPETADFPPTSAQKPSPAPKTQSGPKIDPVAPPIPHPDPDVDEDRRHKCVGRPGAARGGHNCHNDFALHVTGTNRDWDVVSSTAERASFDGVDATRTVYDVKTGYRLLVNPDPKLIGLRQRILGKLQDQAARQQRIAHACGYRLLWVFNDQEVQEFIDGFIEPETEFQDFPCDPNKTAEEGDQL
jgi:Domain of unknown function (DUF4157)